MTTPELLLELNRSAGAVCDVHDLIKRQLADRDERIRDLSIQAATARDALATRTREFETAMTERWAKDKQIAALLAANKGLAEELSERREEIHAQAHTIKILAGLSESGSVTNTDDTPTDEAPQALECGEGSPLSLAQTHDDAIQPDAPEAEPVPFPDNKSSIVTTLREAHVSDGQPISGGLGKPHHQSSISAAMA